MPNLTLSIADETKKRMSRHPEIKWSNAVRAIIEQKLSGFEEAERLAQKSTLLEKDVMLLSKKADAVAAAHAKRLLNETGG